MTDKNKSYKLNILGLGKRPIFYGPERRKMVLRERERRMESMLPEGAKIPENNRPAETQTGLEYIFQEELDAAAKARGELIEELC